MADDIDFDMAASDIMEQTAAINDVQLVLNIEKWVSKLITGHRGPNEFNYLRLLQLMVNNRMIGQPFIRVPPQGYLLPLSRYINAKPCDNMPTRFRPDRCNVDDRWQMTVANRTVQTEFYEEKKADEEREGEELQQKDGDGADNVNNNNVGVDTETADVKAEVPDVKPEDAENGDAARGEETKQIVRDGHLASGGGEYKGCFGGVHKSGGHQSNVQARRLFEVCDPCLDHMGQHLKKPIPRPMGHDYRGLLGDDCACPVFSESERNTVDPELLRVLQNVNESTTLQDFYFQVSLYTCDQGALLISLSNSVLDDFHTFASNVFETRVENISDGLVVAQMVLCAKYAYLKHRIFNRATVALDYLREVMPAFSWTKYQADPGPYLMRTVFAKSASSGDTDEASGGDETGRQLGKNASASGDELSERGGGGGGGPDVRKQLYALNWLRTEVSRVDCEGQELLDQRSGLTVKLANETSRLSAAQCRTSDQVNRLKNELTLLRRRSADQTTSIDKLMDTIQLLMQQNTMKNC